MNSKYLALDIGNVVLDMNFERFLSVLSTTMNISKADAWSFLERTQKLHDLGYTMIRDEIRDHFKIHSEDTIEIIMSEWNKTLTPNLGVIQWVEMLLDKGVKIALVSNMGHEHLSVMDSLLGDKIHKGCIRFFSADVGARKPSLSFYHIFLSLYPEFKGALYLDDNELNIEVGLKFGLNSVAFDLSKMSIEETTAKVKTIEEQLFLTP